MNKREFLRASLQGGAVIGVSIGVRTVVGIATHVTLARMLDPKLFGQVVFATTVAMFFNALSNLHGDKYVIQQRDCPRRAVDIAFTLELLVAGLFVALVLLLAPLIMDFLGKSELTRYVQLLALAFLYNPLSRPRCLTERDLSFVRSKFPFVISQVLASASSITLAALGAGVWSLIWWRLSALFGETVILWSIADRRPRIAWDADVARSLLRFSWPLIGSSFLVFFYYNIDYFIIGQFLKDGETQLSYYWLGFQAASYFLVTRELMYEVLFPVFCRLDQEEFKTRGFERFTHAVAALFLLFTITAIIFGRDIITGIYGKKWEPAVFPFQIDAITTLMRVVSANITYYLRSCGHTRPEFTMALIFSLLLPPCAYFATIQFGINGTAVAVLIVQLVVVIYAFEHYIKPMTGTGVLHFFSRPWLISIMALVVALGSHALELGLLVRSGSFVILMFLAYVSVCRPVLRDVTEALRLVRRAHPGAVAGAVSS